MDADLIIQRLKDRVPDLGARVFGAAEFANLTTSGKLPQTTPAAHVITSGIAGGKHHPQLGSYIQTVDRLYSVILTLRSQDASGARALPKIDGLIADIIAALAGWDIDGRHGVFILRRAELLRTTEGMFVYQISFSITDQLRIIPS